MSVLLCVRRNLRGIAGTAVSHWSRLAFLPRRGRPVGRVAQEC